MTTAKAMADAIPAEAHRLFDLIEACGCRSRPPYPVRPCAECQAREERADALIRAANERTTDAR
jgi:hypothetical protein